MAEIKIDLEAMAQQMKDYCALELLKALSPDKRTADLTVEAMEVYIRHGVSVETALKIITELQPIFNKYYEQKETEE